MEQNLLVRRKKMAVIVGCNYSPLEEYHLRGAHTGASKMHQILRENFGFQPEHMKLMLDNRADKTAMHPNGRNIKRELYSMIGQAKPGDALFFYFAGHGVRSNMRDLESIVPSDKNLITRVDFRHMVNKVPKGATFTIMADSSTSGGLIDKEPMKIGSPASSSSSEDDEKDFVQGGWMTASSSSSQDNEKDFLQGGKMKASSSSSQDDEIQFESFLMMVSSQTGLKDPNIGVHMLCLFGEDASMLFRLPYDLLPKPLKADQGILLSACQAGETAYECLSDMSVTGIYIGAFTNAFIMILKQNSSPTNRKIILLARDILKNQQTEDNKIQYPCLYCSGNNDTALFLNGTR